MGEVLDFMIVTIASSNIVIVRRLEAFVGLNAALVGFVVDDPKYNAESNRYGFDEACNV